MRYFNQPLNYAIFRNKNDPGPPTSLQKKVSMVSTTPRPAASEPKQDLAAGFVGGEAAPHRGAGAFGALAGRAAPAVSGFRVSPAIQQQ